MMYYPCPWLEFIARYDLVPVDVYLIEAMNWRMPILDKRIKQYWEETEAVFGVKAADNTIRGEIFSIAVDFQDQEFGKAQK